MIYYTTYVRFCQGKSNARSEHMFPVECLAGLIARRGREDGLSISRGSPNPLLYYIMLYINNNIMSKVYNDSNI